MAQVFPAIENIEALKVKPTPGEWFLLKYLANNMPHHVEIYFQPYFNGDMPDIILMGKGIGVAIIEVKDWDLNSYYLDNNADWHIKNNDAKMKKPPYKQVFSYKDNMFNLHINGLLEKKILNNKFYGRINAFVYFHGSSRNDIKRFFNKVIGDTENRISELNEGDITPHGKKLYFLYNFKKKLYKQRDYYSVTVDNINNIALPKKIEGLFSNSIYQEFHRYLQPPFHTVEQGRHIQYTKKQKSLSISHPKQQKIKGVAGAGKTLILAKRAVDSHKRHHDRILILTFNITLTGYIHDMVSDVRESFDWKNFTIVNYHHFFNSMANNYELHIKGLEDYKDEQFFDDADDASVIKYKAIFIDEIQDYDLAWIKIVKKYFLVEDGEFVVFGDEKQNIYDQKLDITKKPHTTIGGAWNQLDESFRLSTIIAELAEDFQSTFFKEKYEIDKIESVENTQKLLDIERNIIKQLPYESNNNEGLVKTIFEFIRAKDTHPNDICILAQNIELLRNIDHIIRLKFNEKTLTTFETKEVYEHLADQFKNNKKLPERLKSQFLENEIRQVRRVKKVGFRLNGGTIKLSTIHSFKGWEIPTLFLIIDSDVDEVIYTAITRARHNIVIFNTHGNKYYDFLETNSV